MKIKRKPNNSARARHYSYYKAIRKQKIDHSLSWNGHYFYNNLHQYSKNKIHCSCSMCSEKTRNKGHRRWKAGNYSRSINYKASDLRRWLMMNDQEKEFYIDFS